MRTIVYLIFCCCYSYAQSVTIDFGDARTGPEEPTICISPIDSNVVLAAANINKQYRSLDGGKTWEKLNITSSLGIFGDPCIVADEYGHFYFFHLSDPDGIGWKSDKLLDRIVCQVSKDNGKTWSDGTSIGLNHPKDQDKEWAVYNPITKEIGVAWTEFDHYGSDDASCESRILFSKASIKSMKWSKPKKVSQYSGNCIDDSKTAEGAYPTYDKKGRFYVTWALDNTIYMDYLENNSFQKEDIKIMEIPGGWDIPIEGVGRANGFPIMKINPHNNHFYLNWCDQRSGVSKVYFAYSKNNGKKWSKPLSVANTTKHTEFFTWMDFNPKSNQIHFVYYQIKEDQKDRIETQYASYHLKKKEWLNITLSDKPFETPGSVFFGDYNNIDVVGGQIRPIWTEYENNTLSIKTKLLHEK